MNTETTTAALLKLARQQLDHRVELAALVRKCCSNPKVCDLEEKGMAADRELLDTLEQSE